MHNRWTIAATAAAIVALGALSACGRKDAAGGTQGTSGGDVIRIGHVAPLSGGDSHLGKDNENGARLAADEINAAGGVKLGDKTYKVEILGEDDKADPREGTLAAQKLVDEGVVAVVGQIGRASCRERVYSIV
jgi:branched-chain amino acid transport system substrate-binding protein